ncbi:hypothetical protein A6R68_03757, partial [Neotoma lepida]
AIGCVKMKLNISFPATSCQKLIQLEDEHKLCMFYEKHMATEVAADALGEEWKGYVVRISGRNDKQHFPRKQGILTHSSVVHLLLSKEHSYYRPRRGSTSLFTDASWMPISVFSTRLLQKRRVGYPWVDRHYCASLKAIKQRRQEAQDQGTQDSASCHSTCHATQTSVYCSKKQWIKKNKEEAAEYAQLSAKRMKESQL